MTNREKFKTAKEMGRAFDIFCKSQKHGCNMCPLNKYASDLCRFAWIDMEYKEELKKCPFCGGKAILYAAGIPYVRCDNCGTQTTAYQTPDEAISAWNRRHNND